MMESDGGLNLSIFHSRPTSQLTVEHRTPYTHGYKFKIELDTNTNETKMQIQKQSED